MGALATRAWIARSGDYYLCPLGGKQIPEDTLAALLAPVFNGAQPLEPVYAPAPDLAGPPVLIAEGYALAVDLMATVEGQPVTWREQRLVVRSVAQAARQTQALDARLQQAVAAIHRLNERKQGQKILEAPALNAAAEQMLAQQRVVGLVQLDLETTTQVIPQRRYGARAATCRVQHQCTLRAWIDPPAVAAARQRLGWRVYATNQAALTVEITVQAYRGQSLIKRSFGRLKSRALAITPLFLQTNARVEGLIRLLSLALRVLVLVEFVARRCLATTREPIAGLYPGQATRATASPNAELLLRAFRGISLSVVEIAGQVRGLLSPLSAVHHRALALLDWSAGIYEQLMMHFLKPALILSEP